MAIPHAFLPLTVAAARHAEATAVARQAVETDRAATDCWASLLAGCTSPGRWGLGPRLRQLSEATSQQVGTRWWSAEGAAYRRRVARAQAEIEDAIAEGDGQEFARAFVGYDHAMASAVVCAEQRTGSPTA